MSTAAATNNKNQNGKRKISIMCMGSRGDFQPYLALAIQLKESGFYVRLLSIITFQSFAEEYGIEFVNVKDLCIDKELAENEDARKAMMEGNLSQLMKTINKSSLEHAPFTINAYINEMKNHTPDLFISGSLCEYYGSHARHVLRIPTLDFHLSTIIHNPKRAMFGLPTLPFGLHSYLIKVIMGGMYKSWKFFDDIIETLDSARLTDIYTKADWDVDFEETLLGKSSVIVCQSEVFKDVLAPDASDSVCFTGTLCIDASKQTQNSSGTSSFGGNATQTLIDDFINSQPENKPLYLGWGSMISNSPEYMLELVVSTLYKCNERAIVLGGTAGLSLDMLKQSSSDQALITFAEENILFVKSAAHEDLFPRVKCIVHHGGAGTTNAALRSGVPSIITPVFGDQFDHAYVLNELGIGYGFETQFQKIKAEALSVAISDVLGNGVMKERAAEVGKKVRDEDGNAAAVNKIVEYINEDNENRLNVSERRRKAIQSTKKSEQRSKMLFVTSFLLVPFIAYSGFLRNLKS